MIFFKINFYILEISSHQSFIPKSSALELSSNHIDFIISKTSFLSNQPFSRFFVSFFLAAANQSLIIFKNFSSETSLYKLCVSKSNTLDSTFGAGTKLSFETKICHVTCDFLSTKSDKTEVLFLLLFNILSHTSCCIRITILSGLCSKLYKKCLNIGLVI
jgi:hypothetical protein